MSLSLDDFRSRFDEEPGYFDFASVGPPGETVLAEALAQNTLLSRARFGSLDAVRDQHGRVRDAVASVTGFRSEQIVFQPNTSSGLMHALFGITGGDVLLSAAEFPSLPFAAVRAEQALKVTQPRWLQTDHGRVTPAAVREQLDDSVTAVAVSLVDFRTGHVADIDGIRQVIGNRLLIVDAIQGFGVVDAPYTVADVVVSGGQKWVRSGWGTGFLAMSDRAAEQLIPVFSGFTGTDEDELPLDEVPDPSRGVGAYTVSNPDPIAMARFAAALEEIAEVGVATIQEALSDTVEQVVTLADEFGMPLISTRDVAERAGIVVLEPPVDQLNLFVASLHNQGVTATVRSGAIRISPHVTTTRESMDMLKAALISYASAATY
jgi:selenocysteine lyase/cysteine desulfurase